MFVPLLCERVRRSPRQQRAFFLSLFLSFFRARIVLCTRLLYLHRHVASPADHNRVRHHRDVVLLQILLIFLLLLVDRVEIRHRALRIHRALPRERDALVDISVATTYYDDVLRARLLFSHWGQARTTTRVRGRDALASGAPRSHPRRDGLPARRHARPVAITARHDHHRGHRDLARSAAAAKLPHDNDDNATATRYCRDTVLARCTTLHDRTMHDAHCGYDWSIGRDVHCSQLTAHQFFFSSLRLQACQQYNNHASQPRARASALFRFNFERWHLNGIEGKASIYFFYIISSYRLREMQRYSFFFTKVSSLVSEICKIV